MTKEGRQFFEGEIRVSCRTGWHATGPHVLQGSAQWSTLSALNTRHRKIVAS